MNKGSCLRRLVEGESRRGARRGCAQQLAAAPSARHAEHFTSATALAYMRAAQTQQARVVNKRPLPANIHQQHRVIRPTISRRTNVTAAPAEAAVVPEVPASLLEIPPWKQHEELILSRARGDPQRRQLHAILTVGRDAHGKDEEALLLNAQHVFESIQARLARTVSSFKVLPEPLQQNEDLMRLAHKMLEPVQELSAFQEECGVIDTLPKHVRFCALLRSLTQRGMILGDGEALAQLRGAVAKARNVISVDPCFFDHFVSSVLMHSVSCVVGIQHHLLLSDSHRGNNHVGAFDTQLRPVATLRDCAFKTQAVCYQELGSSPRIDVKGDITATLEYIEPHFRYILTEVLKNAVHATVRRHRTDDKSNARGQVPPVQVVVESDEKSIIIRVSDEGGGMCPTVFSNVWRYGYTTAHVKKDEEGGGLAGEQAAVGSGLAGWGFGLPRSQVYARYLGGNISMVNDHGHGCNATLTFPKAACHTAAEFLSFTEIPHLNEASGY